MKLDGGTKDKYPPLCMDFAEQLQEENFFDIVNTGDGTLLSVLSQGQTPVHGVEIEEFPQAQETTDVKVHDQNNVDLLFRHQEYHVLLICTQRDHCYQTFYVEMLKRLIHAAKYKRGEL
jgi:hypothetical protein